MIDLTIIVPTRNHGDSNDHTRKINYATNLCLKSLLKTTPKEVKIIVASNGGDAKHVDVDGSIHGGTRIHRINLWNQGQCKAVNAASALVQTKWIMVTNDDMIFPDGWLERLLEPYGFASECVSPKLVEPNEGAPTFIKYNCGGADGDFNYEKFEHFVRQYKIDKNNLWQNGFNLPFIIKTDLWRKIDGYDISYDPWSSNSDSDLLYKIKLAGVSPKQSQASLVYHFSQTSGTFHPDHQEAWNKNWNYFIDKWGFERASSPEIWTGEFDIPLDKLKYRPNWAKL